MIDHCECRSQPTELILFHHEKNYTLYKHSQNMVKHDRIRDELAKQLEHSMIEYSSVQTEQHVDPPRKIGTGRIDIVWQFSENESAEGVAFEVKTRLPNQSKVHVRMDAIRQLHRCALCGYYPVLVASRDVYNDTCGSTHSLKRLVRALGASYVEVSENPIEFSLAQDSLSVETRVPIFLQ